MTESYTLFLELMVSNGIQNIIIVQHQLMHTDIHPHFQCLSYGKVDCLDVNMNIPKIPNREVIFSQLLIQGNVLSLIFVDGSAVILL